MYLNKVHSEPPFKKHNIQSLTQSLRKYYYGYKPNYTHVDTRLIVHSYFSHIYQHYMPISYPELGVQQKIICGTK